MKQPVFLGIDLGTSGLRVVALDEKGILQAEVGETWGLPEMDPQVWLQRLWHLLQRLPLAWENYSIAAVSVCSTSGTILPVDQQGNALAPAVLYSDSRADTQAKQLGVARSWGLARWLWWAETHPLLYSRSYLAHPTDFLLTALGSDPHLTDHTSALKSGFDLGSYTWPELWLDQQGLSVDKFPQVVAPGTRLARISKKWTLGSSAWVVAGCTDGCAGQLVTGAVSPGQLSTSLGSTLIFKGVSSDPIQTTDGSVYSHLHPDRTTWLPGAASFCGGGCLPYFFPGADFSIWDQQVLSVLPTGWVSYPLWQPGERFPVADSKFSGFLPFPHDRLRFYGSLLEGVAYVERLGIERLQALGVRGEGSLLTVGGACRSRLWLQIRASILQKSLLVPRYNQPAVGAAILAAAGFWQCSVTEAVKELVHLQDPVDPVIDWVDPYEAGYQEFQCRVESFSGAREAYKI